MKRLFGHKPKSAKPSKDFGEELPKQPPFSTPLYQKLATQGAQIHGSTISQPSLQHSTQQIPSPSEDEWSISHQQPYPPPPLIHTPSRSNSLNSIPHMPAASLPPPPRSASPMSTMSMGGTRLLRPHDQDRKVAPSALGILGALDPPRTDGSLYHRSGGKVYSDDRSRTETITPSESGHGHGPPSEREREKKKGFWSRDKEKEKEREKERDREREREKEWQREMQQRKEEYDRGQKERAKDGTVRREEDPQDELTRMIGYLTATASEDWQLVLGVCERASANETSAKEAVRALRREFKYGEPAAQLSAARLWAIMLRNSSDMFITQSTSRKFLDTLEELLSSSRTSPVVRERLLEVVGAAAFASGSKKGNDRDGFKGLWKRVKPIDKPEEGVPFDMDDAMFQPPQSGRQSGYEVPLLNYQEASPLPTESNPATPTPRTVKDRKSQSRGDRIIPRDEDIRRLLQECRIGQGNAGVLTDALIGARPEDLTTTDVIKEFHSKCCASQELIYAQIPWATSIAEHSRLSKLQPAPQHARKRTMSSEKHLNTQESTTSPPAELTIEEQLLAELLAANANLMDVLSQWQDLNRVAIERQIEDRSKKGTRMERKEYESSISTLDSSLVDHIPPSRSHSPIFPSHKSHPAPPSTYSDHRQTHSRQPSIQDHDSDTSLHHQQNFAPPPSAPHGPRLPVPVTGPPRSRTPSPVRIGRSYGNGLPETSVDSDSSLSSQEEEQTQPSAKALGKRKVVEPEVTPDRGFDPDDIYYPNGRAGQPSRESSIGPGEDSRWRPPQAKFVYDAVAERTRQLMVESKPPSGQHPKRVNGVH